MRSSGRPGRTLEHRRGRSAARADCNGCGREGSSMTRVDVDDEAPGTDPPANGGAGDAAESSTLGRHNIWTLLVVCAATFMLLLDVTIVVVALPDIQNELNAGFASVQWVIDAYALTLAALLLVSGALADRYGLRLVFTIGLGVFTIGSALCAVAQDPTMLILSRALQGVGG